MRQKLVKKLNKLVKDEQIHLSPVHEGCYTNPDKRMKRNKKRYLLSINHIERAKLVRSLKNEK